MIGLFFTKYDDPFDLAPMLILADWLEEHGDAAGAFALRGLAGAGIASLHVLALQGALGPLPFNPDLLRSAPTSGNGDGDGFTFGAGGESGYGYGDGYGERPKEGSGDGFGEGFGFGDGCGHGEECCSEEGIGGEGD